MEDENRVMISEEEGEVEVFSVNGGSGDWREYKLQWI